jgi:hypothetical protein
MIRKPKLNQKFISGLSFLEEIYKKPPPPIKSQEGLQYTSERSLNILLNNPPLDVCEVSELKHISFTEEQKSFFYNTLAEQYPKCSILLSGHFFYPENGYMSWHTNNKAPGLRLYLSYTEYQDGSHFLYKSGDKIIKDADNKGWTLREFDINKENLLWHSVFAHKPRISLGFRIVKNLL